ncbi:MAG: hypothetical protein H7177_06340 [Rhizobacter sp.]|nr:hypothetical protein [Bacteriovorax sp.]
MHIIIMRHAEKPFSGNSLSEAGHLRATLLPEYFESNKTIAELGPPAAMYAIAPVSVGRSVRSIQTLLPMANHFKITLNQKYTKYQLEELAEAVKTDNQSADATVIICCNRGSIPVLARLFGVKNAPEIWSSEIYNKLWIVNFKENENENVSLDELSLNILPSDIS